MVRSLRSAGAVLGAALMAASFAAAQPAPDFLIEPGRRAGPVTKDMTEARLKALLPKGQVKRVLRPAGEGSFDCGTEIFSGTGNAAFVSWGTMTRSYEEDSPRNVKACLGLPSPSKPQAIEIGREPEGPWPESAWRTARGIRLGMTVRELEAALGGSFDFSVCSCDFGGVVFKDSVKTNALEGVSLWIDFPTDAEDTLKKVVRVQEDYAVKSSAVPASMVKDFRVSKIEVPLGGAR